MLARRSAFVAVVGLVLTVSVMAGPAGAAPTGTVPAPSPPIATPADKVTAVGSSVVRKTPLGRLWTGANWVMRIAGIVDGGSSAIGLLEGWNAGDGSRYDPLDKIAPDGTRTESTNSFYCANTINNGFTQRTDSGIGRIVVNSVSYSPSEAYKEALAQSPGATDMCKIDPDGTGPQGPTPVTDMSWQYFCLDSAGQLVRETSGANSGLPRATTAIASRVFAGFTLGGQCPVGGAIAYFRWWPDAGDSYHYPGTGTWVRPGFDVDNLITTTVEVDCENLTTGQKMTVRGAYTPDGDGQMRLNIPGCPSGMEPVTQRTYAETPGRPGGGVTRDLLQEETVDVPGLREKYPSCATVGCELEVYVDGTKCVVGAADCWNWWETAQQTPERVKCMWGPYAMPLSDCEPQVYVYRTGRTTPDPANPNAPWVAAQPDGQPDPAAAPTVTVNPNPTPDPNPQPVPKPAPNPDPSGEPPVDPTPDNPDDPLPDPDGEAGNCWGGMASWNPIDWVVTPVKCALVWAFVPRPDVLTDQLTDLSDVGPGPWVAAAGDLVEATAITGPGACAGPAWNLGATAVTDATTLHPFWACGGPQATIAGVVRIGLTVLVWLGAGVVSLRLVGSAFGLNLNGFGGRDEDV